MNITLASTAAERRENVLQLSSEALHAHAL